MNKLGILISSVVFTLAFSQCKAQEAVPASNGQQQSQRQQGPPNTNEMFVQMDANKDGKLSLQEVQGPLKNDFSKIDTDGDGFLSKKEIEAASKPNGGQRPPR